MFRPVTPADAVTIAAIYNHYVVNTFVTFEEEAVSAMEMQRRFTEVAEARLPWLVWEEAGLILGFAYAGKWKSRCAYRYSVESTIYLEKDAVGHHRGTRLYLALIETLRPRGIHSILGGVALPNTASVALHEKLGFQKIAHFKEVGWKFERWIDVGYWELIPK
jgi:L-amino acid N-acyltransferase YncA